MEVAIVVGGGNFWRGRSSGSMDRTRADHMGMLATVINALGVADGLEQLGLDVRVQTAIAMQEVAEPYIRNRAVRHLEKGRVVVFRLWHGQPLLLHGYRRCPARGGDRGRCDSEGHHGGRRLRQRPQEKPQRQKSTDTLSYMDVLNQNLGVMDMTAASFCKDRNIPFLVFSIEDPENIVRAVSGEESGHLGPVSFGKTQKTMALPLFLFSILLKGWNQSWQR